MATVTSTLSLRDRMSNVLRRINGALTGTTRTMIGANAVASRGFSGTSHVLDGWRGKIMAADAAMNIFKQGMSVVGRLAAQSDAFTQTTARLNNMNDKMQTTAELQDMITQSANRSRASFAETSNAVGQLGMNAKDAFSSTEEIVAFSELLNKSFKISGTDAQAQAGAMRQLTQAMASGVLRGDEFNSIAEQAPMVYDAIAKHLGKSKGEVRALAGEGKLTANVVKAAMFSMAEEIDAQFENMPVTWGDRWTQIQNSGMTAFQPLLEKINELANNAALADFLIILQAGFEILGDVASGVIDRIIQGLDWMRANSEKVKTAITVLGVVGAAMAARWLISWTVANWPMFLIIAAIGLVIAILNKMGISGEQVLGAIMGAISWTIGLFKNLGLVVLNVAAGVSAAFSACVHNIVTAFGNAGHNIRSFFYNLMSTVLGFVASIAEALNKLPFVEFDYAGISGKAADYANKAAEEQAAKGEYADVGAAWTDASNKHEAFQRGWGGDAYNRGQGWAENMTGALGDIVDSLNIAGTEGIDYSKFEGGGGSGGGAGVDNVGRVGSVGKIEDEVSIAEEDIKLLKDVASMEYQLHYTQMTPSFTANFGDVRETADVDGILEALISQGNTALNSSLAVG